MDKRVVGVLGGGQLGRMMVEAANRLNIQVAVLDGPSAPAKQVSSSDSHLNGAFSNPQDVSAFAAKVDVLTVEIEHVSVDALEAAASAHPHLVIQPSPKTLRIIQDKYAQKVHLAQYGIPLPEFKELPLGKEAETIKASGFGYPVMLKAKRQAYDGKGNFVIESEAGIAAGLKALSTHGKSGLYIEKWVQYEREVAVMVAKSVDGSTAVYPVAKTIQRDNICHAVLVPAQLDARVAARAKYVAEETIKAFDGAGIFGVEMFQLENGEILVNEIAPRPHNSGHYTIEGCHTSQFEQHLRAILGLPLGNPSLRVPFAAMINIIGLGSDAKSVEETFRPCQNALSVPGAAVHLYGKQECRAGRKMGHITLTATNLRALHQAAKAVMPTVYLPINRLPIVGIIMGSDSDMPTMKPAYDTLINFDIPVEITIVSAHRTPDRMVEYARTARERGIKVIIAGAGGAAHLPGMVAALTPVPVIGVPVALKVLDGMDSLYSIVQMPSGVPVATVAINGAKNAAILATRMLGVAVPDYTTAVAEFMEDQRKTVMEKIPDHAARFGTLA